MRFKISTSQINATKFPGFYKSLITQ